MPATLPQPTSAKSPTVTMLTPNLVCRDANGAIEFYKRAFDAHELRAVRTPDGSLLHAALTIGDAMFFLAEERPQFCSNGPQALGGSPVTLNLHAPDCDAVFDRAIAAGCTPRMPPQDMFWGDRYAVLSDPYGHVWSIATKIKHVSLEEMEQGAAACAAAMQNAQPGCPGAAR